MDWALELSKSSNISLIHRRNEFRGAPHTLAEIKKKEKEGKISIKTPCQLKSIDGNDPKQFNTTPTSSPILLRGTLWTENNTIMILHRSPPIEGTGETRFVFVIDPIFDPENEV